MVHIYFILDTSLSMSQKSYFGLSYLDIAKASIETFLKVFLNIFLFIYLDSSN